MTPEEGREYQATKARVTFGMNPEKLPDAKLRHELMERMRKRGCQAFIPLRVPVEEFSTLLFENPDLNRIYSISLDALECLPFRPDMAFDRWWTAFEVLLHKYASMAWSSGGGPLSTADLFGRFANEVLVPEMDSDVYLRCAAHSWCLKMPDSIARYGAVRMLLDREIKVDSQFGHIKERAVSIMRPELYGAFAETYLTNTEGHIQLNDSNHHRAARKLRRMLTGERLTFGGEEIRGIDMGRRLEFLLSCILYASRCERLHGDYFSPFFSDRAKMGLYEHWYWLADTTYILFLALFKRIVAYRELPNPISSRRLAGYIKAVAKNYARLFGKEKNTSKPKKPQL